jgi:sterol 24-C-methyltransferase
MTRYYDLVTDDYITGWGENFHYCPFPVSHLPIRSMKERHNFYLAHWLSLRPGMRVLDVGCGIGGPGRTIAKFVGCEIVGLNINQYQLALAKERTGEEGLSHLCTYVEGDFSKMPFADESFDAVFAIEVLCQAANLKNVYTECYRVLKKGGKFGFYEECMTDKFDIGVYEHRRVRNSIERGAGVAAMPHVEEIRDALPKAGFLIEHEEDTGNHKEDPLKWYWPLEGIISITRDWYDFWIVLGLTWWFMDFLYYWVWIKETLGFFPKGSIKTLVTLRHCVDGYKDGGRLGIFTPVQLFISKKPEQKSSRNQ